MRYNVTIRDVTHNFAIHVIAPKIEDIFDAIKDFVKEKNVKIVLTKLVQHPNESVIDAEYRYPNGGLILTLHAEMIGEVPPRADPEPASKQKDEDDLTMYPKEMLNVSLDLYKALVERQKPKKKPK